MSALLRYYVITRFCCTWVCSLQSYYLITLLHDYLRIFFYTLLPCYSATCVSSIMSTLLPHYAITRVCSLESYHVITLLRYYTILCECILYVVTLLRCYARFFADVSSIFYTLLQVYILLLLYCLLTLLWTVIFLPFSFPMFTCSN